MKINYILSDTTKNATTLALKKINSESKQNLFEDYIVLVPETKSIIIEKELLKLSKDGAFANVFVYNFVRLMTRMGLVDNKKIANKQTAIMLLRKVIYENQDRLTCYQKTSKTAGFAEKIYETIQQIKSSNLSIEDLKLSLETTNQALKQKLIDLIMLYEEYENAKSERLLDECDKLSLLVKFAKSSEVIKNSHIFVVGFDNITTEMQSVLKEFAKNAKSITFSSVYFSQNRSDSYIQKNDLFNKFKHIGDEMKIPYIPSVSNTYSSGDFYQIASKLFSTKKETAKSNGNVKVFEAQSVNEELEFVANNILNEIKNGKRYRDIGVLANNLVNIKDDIEKVFVSYNIPYFVNSEYDVSIHFYVRFLKDIFSLITSNFSYEKVFLVMANPLFACKDFSAVYQFVNESGINYNKFLNELNEDKYSKFASFVNASEDLKEFGKFAKTLKEKCKKEDLIKNYIEIIDYINQYFSVAEKLPLIIEFERENGQEIEAKISEKILEKIEQYNDMVLNFMGNVNSQFDEFVQIYFSGLGSTKINLLPVSLDCVVIQSNTDGFFDILDLFIINANEGNFPTKLQDSGILQDSELELTKTYSQKEIEPSVKQINARENFKAYESLLEPKEKLFISYSLKDNSGVLTKPARIVDRLINLFGNDILINNFQTFENQPRTVLEKQFAKSVGKFLSKNESNTNVDKIYGALGGKLDEKLSSYLNSEQFVGEDFNLKNIDNLYFKNNMTSVSQLEKYFACPYQFFVNYGLRLKENENAKVSGLDVGLIIHRVVELFMKNIAFFETLEKSEFENEVKKLMNQAIEENNIVVEYNKAILKLLEKESIRITKYLLYERENSCFKTNKNGTEVAFLGKNSVEIPLDEKTSINLQGKIDRVDEWKDYVRIIDYKTGDVSSDLASIYSGKKIQLVSYLSAVNKMNNKKVAGLFYLPIHSDFSKTDDKQINPYKYQGFVLDDVDILKNMDNNLTFDNPESLFIPLKIKTSAKNREENIFEFFRANNGQLSEKEFEDVKDYTEKLCAQAVREIKSGYIEPSPLLTGSEERPAICSWCKYASICGVEKTKYAHGRSINLDVKKESFDLGKNNGENDGRE